MKTQIYVLMGTIHHAQARESTFVMEAFVNRAIAEQKLAMLLEMFNATSDEYWIDRVDLDTSEVKRAVTLGDVIMPAAVRSTPPPGTKECNCGTPAYPHLMCHWPMDA